MGRLPKRLTDLPQLPRKYQDVFITVSTPYGIVNVGWKLERKNRSSNILCLLCADQEQLHASETLKRFTRHLREEHPEVVRFALQGNFDKMIV